MFPSLSEYLNHSSTYAELIAQLEFNVAFAQTIDEKCELIDSFSKSYLTPHQIWYTRIRWGRRRRILRGRKIHNFRNLNPEDDEYEDLARGSVFHFSNDSRIFKQFYTFNKFIIQQTHKFCFKINCNREKRFDFPHANLEFDYLLYQWTLSEFAKFLVPVK